jgi:transposase
LRITAGGPRFLDVAKTFRPYLPEQTLLLPPALEDWLPEGHLARFISDVVDSLDLSEIEKAYGEERGYPPYHPSMMLKVLLYGYCTGTYSSRRLAGLVVDSVACRYLAAGNEPDFRTLNEFRRRHGKVLEKLFVQVLKLCQKAGLVKLGRVAVDGTKVKANASKHKAMSYERMKEKEAELEGEVRGLMREADRIDEEEDRRYGKDRRGDELPAELARRESRLKKIREAKAALEAEAKEKALVEGKPEAEAQPAPKAQRNFTDPESRILKGSDGFIQGYNAQVAVDDTSQVIVSQLVTQATNDVKQLRPVMEKIETTLGELPKVALADAGYYSEANDEYLWEQGVDAYIATGRLKHGLPSESSPRGRIPQGLGLRERMSRKLKTADGQAHYARRKAIVEPVFGQIKQARAFRQFLRRGLDRVAQEWSLICLAHNLLKLFGNQAAA